MAWSKSATDPNVYQRPLGPAEAPMIAALTAERPFAREHIKINAIAHLTAPYPADTVSQAFREAWKAVRFLKSPDIATTFDNGNKYYKIPTAEELEVWLNETFAIAPTGTTVLAAIEAMQQRVELLPVCEILPQPTTDGNFKGSIILFVSHWRTEAGGCFMIINQLLDLVADSLAGGSIREALACHVSGSETQLLTPVIEELLMPNAQSSPEATIRVEQRVADYISKLPCVDYPLRKDATATPSDFVIMQRTYTPASTSAFVKACRSEGISVTAAIHAAYLDAVWSVAHSKDRPWTCIMPAEVRKRLPTSSPFRDQGAWSAAQFLLISVPPGQRFLARARDLKSQYAIAAQESWLREDMRETTNQFMQSFSKVPLDQPTSLPFFTSLGVIDGMIAPDHQGIKIEHVTGWADSISPGIVLRMWTFRERLNIHIAWNVAFHSDAQIRETLDIIDKTITTELGTELVVESVTGADGF